ncbi:MAG: LytR/AlgR family response regulator transcription factor [Candidatus Coproplasma sp.]
MRILAVDDERLALEALTEAIRSVCPQAELKGVRYAEDAIEYAKESVCDVAFLDIEMAGINGVTLALRLKELNPVINVIFVTGYGNYRSEAFDMHASGYVVKPVTCEKVAAELANLRHPVSDSKRIDIHTFGNFEVYLDGKPLTFRYTKTLELLAYLVDRKGATCSVGEMIAVLFEDEADHTTYFKSLRADLLNTFKGCGCEGVIARRHGMLGVVKDAVSCDYFDFLEGKAVGANAYCGEYMSQYSWAEVTHAYLEKHSRIVN